MVYNRNYNRNYNKRYSRNYNKGNYNRNNYNRYYNNNYRPSSKKFQGILDLKPDTTNANANTNTANTFVRTSLTIGQLDLLRQVLTFIREKNFTATNYGLSNEELNTAHKVLMTVYNHTATKVDVPNKEQWREFYTWLSQYNKQ